MLGKPEPSDSPVVLPELDWLPAEGYGHRNGAVVSRVVVHRWGVRIPTSFPGEKSIYNGTVNFLRDKSHGASAHIVFPGSASPGRAAQLVRWDNFAWAEAAYNPTSDEIESADLIWVGRDPHGFKTLARIVAYRLHVRKLPPVWSHERGFCRHADLGAAGGGHTSCPTTDLSVWKAFSAEVQTQYYRGGFRNSWGR